MQRKLKGVADPDQEPLGGRLKEQSPLERSANGAAEAPGAAGGASDLLEAVGGGAAPQAGQTGAAADSGGGGGGGGGMFGGGGGGGGPVIKARSIGKNCGGTALKQTRW